MLGAILGDMIGSRGELGCEKTKDFELFDGCNEPTDDSVMTIAVGLACCEASLTDAYDFKRAVVRQMRAMGARYPYLGYGGTFVQWLRDEDMGPYGSYGNGSAMRVSAVAWVAESLSEAERLAAWSAEVTHDHPEGVRGAQAVAAAIYLARDGKSKDEIRAYIEQHYYKLDFTLEQIRPTYKWDVTCQGSVPQAIVCFLEGEDFEDTVRNAVSLGGDADTQAAIAGSIAEAYFGIPEDLAEEGLSYLDEDLLADYHLVRDELGF